MFVCLYLLLCIFSLQYNKYISQSSHLTRDAVCLVAERTLEYVDVVVKDRPAGTVRSLAVEGVLHVGLRLLHGLLLVLLIDGWTHQLATDIDRNIFLKV